MGERPVALVTGASRGIGRAICLELATSGHDIVGISRTLESTAEKTGLLDLKKHVEWCGVEFLPLRADVSDIDGHPALVSEIEKVFGRIDLLVNNAGVAPLQRLDILETPPQSFDRVVGVNLRGPFFLTQAVAGAMLDRKRRTTDYAPRIVFITSISAVVSSPNRPEYCISKAGLSMAASLFADRLAGSGIGVFEVRPGVVLTDMTAPVKEKYDRQIAEGLIPQGRWGQPEDVAKVVAALARGDFGYSTGAVFEVSGGMNIRRL